MSTILTNIEWCMDIWYATAISLTANWKNTKAIDRNSILVSLRNLKEKKYL